jgi:ferredoxin
VVVGKAHAQALPRMKWDEQEELDKYPLREDITDTSRLACQITVTPQMEGMLVYVPDGPPVCNI